MNQIKLVNSSIEPFPMSKVREVFPKELTLLEKDMQGINRAIESALVDKERQIIYLIDRAIPQIEIDYLFKVYKDQEKYDISIVSISGNHLEINISL